MPEGWKLRHGERVLKSKKEDRKNGREGKGRKRGRKEVGERGREAGEKE